MTTPAMSIWPLRRWTGCCGCGIIIRPARVTNVSASWDDVSDSPTGRSGFGGFLANTLLESNFQGTVPALSVGVVLSDTRGESLYSRAGGLQVLEYVHRYGHTGYGFRRVNAQSIMTDPARDARALALALGPLTHGDAQAPKAAIAAAPIAATEPAAADNALRVPRPELLARYRTVAIGPLIVGDLPQRAEVEQHYHELLAARLAQLGFNVAGGTEYADLWATEVAAVNGFYDTFTGRMQPAKLQASRKHVFSILHDKYAIDAVVLPQLAVRPVTYQRGERAGRRRWSRWIPRKRAAACYLAIGTSARSTRCRWLCGSRTPTMRRSSKIVAEFRSSSMRSRAAPSMSLDPNCSLTPPRTLRPSQWHCANSIQRRRMVVASRC